MNALARLVASLAVTLAGAGACAFAATPNYPDKPVTLIVPFPPGGGTDIVARLLAAKLQPRLGQPVVIENKPGAATAIGAAALAKAAPDGHTLMLSGSSTYSIVPALKPGLPYDPIESFRHVAVVANAPLALFIGNAVPARTVGELLARARSKPDGEMYATFGNGTGPHLAGAMLAQAGKATLSPVPYKGSSPALVAVIGGEVAFGFDTVAAVAPQVRAGKLKALAVTGDKRSALLPEVPTYAESDVAGASLVSWYGLVAPAKTPDAVMQRLEKEVAAVMADPEVRRTLNQNGLEPTLLDAAAFRDLIRREMAQFRDIAKRSNITLD